MGIYCPHCGNKLTQQHDRKGYVVYSCMNKKCSYYLKNKQIQEDGNSAILKTSSSQDRLSYHYRDFKFNLENLKFLDSMLNSPVNLSRIHFDSNVPGLALTYYVNYGLSSRKTALILKEVHGLKISHHTIINYASSAASAINPFIDNYKYNIGPVLAGDETYIKARITMFSFGLIPQAKL